MTTFKDYLEDDAVKKAQAGLEQNAAAKPADYTSPWQGQMDALYGQIADRKPFQYNIHQDALYNQYKDQYIRGGKLAMLDTMGQASALTGGYGSSYAQQVGQQAFQGYLQGLNDKVPQLYQLALEQYNRQGDDLYKQYGLLGDREQQDYGRYQHALEMWLNDRDYWSQAVTDARDFGYQQNRDQIADDQWEREFAEQVRQFDTLHPQKAAVGGWGGSAKKEKEEEESQKADLQFVAREAADAVKNGASAAQVRAYIYNTVPQVIPQGSSSVADRIAYEMAKAAGVK